MCGVTQRIRLDMACAIRAWTFRHDLKEAQEEWSAGEGLHENFNHICEADAHAFRRNQAVMYKRTTVPYRARTTQSIRITSKLTLQTRTVVLLEQRRALWIWIDHNPVQWIQLSGPVEHILIYSAIMSSKAGVELPVWKVPAID